MSRLGGRFVSVDIHSPSCCNNSRVFFIAFSDLHSHTHPCATPARRWQPATNSTSPPPNNAAAQPTQRATHSKPTSESRSADGRSARPTAGSEAPWTETAPSPSPALWAANGSKVIARPAEACGDAPVPVAGWTRVAAPGPGPASVRPTEDGGAAQPNRKREPGPDCGGGGGAVVAGPAAADSGDAAGNALADIFSVGGDEVGDVMFDPVTLEVRPAPDVLLESEGAVVTRFVVRCLCLILAGRRGPARPYFARVPAA